MTSPEILDAMEQSAHRAVTSFFGRARAQGAEAKVIVAHRAGVARGEVGGETQARLNGSETLELHLNGGARDGEV